MKKVEALERAVQAYRRWEKYSPGPDDPDQSRSDIVVRVRLWDDVRDLCKEFKLDIVDVVEAYIHCEEGALG